MAKSPGAQLRSALKREGRTAAWLARETGYSYPYVDAILHDRSPLTEAFQAKVIAALGADALVPTTFRGRTIRIPENIYKAAADRTAPIAVQDAYEEAWKRDWLAEHGPTVLAIAADRAFQNAGASR